MCGSDWPVCNLAGSYESVSVLMEEYLSQFKEAVVQKVCGGNAIEFYKLNPEG